jgi:hypothetical protein
MFISLGNLGSPELMREASRSVIKKKRRESGFHRIVQLNGPRLALTAKHENDIPVY